MESQENPSHLTRFSSPTTVDPAHAPGTEYKLLLVGLMATALALIVLLLDLIMGASSVPMVALPVAVLVVTVPVAYWLSLRVDKMERQEPLYILNDSRRWSAQFAQVTSFGACLLSAAFFVYTVFMRVAGTEGLSIGKAALDMLVVVAIAGSLFAFYWHGDHNVGRLR